MARPSMAHEIADPERVRRSARRLGEAGIVLPTFAQLADPSTMPASLVARLPLVDPDAADAANLLRVHWFNGADRRGPVDVPGHVVLPPSLTGVDAPIVVALGDRFPMIGAHKVLAAYACLAPAS
jgi:hypothetical protein